MPYERSAQRVDQANGHKSKTMLILAEQDEEWMTAKIYLTMKP